MGKSSQLTNPKWFDPNEAEENLIKRIKIDREKKEKKKGVGGWGGTKALAIIFTESALHADP